MQNIRTWNAQVSIASGGWGCVPMACPYQGRLSRISVVQLDGSQDGFTVDVLDRLDASDAIQQSEVDSTNPDDVFEHQQHKTAHRIVPQMVASDGDEEVRMDDIWAYYANQDELPSNGMRNNLIYVDILPEGAGDKIFLVTITTVRDN